MYSKDLSVKMCSALAVRRKRGDYIGPRPPFGYQFGSDRRKLKIDPVAAGYVKRVFELALQGHSTGQVAIELNREGIPTPGQYKNYEKEKKQYHITGATGHWSSKNVLKILENRVYLGVVVNAKYKVTKIGGHQFKRVPDEERIYVTGRHEAIVTEKEFNGASAVIKYRGEQKGKEYLIKGVRQLPGYGQGINEMTGWGNLCRK